MSNEQKCLVSIKCCKCEAKNFIKYDSKVISQRNEKWHQKLLAELTNKSQCLKQVGKVMMKVIDKKNVLESELREKNEEICKLNDRILTLTTELVFIKKDLEKALGEIKLLKGAVHDCARKNEIIEQKKMLFSRTQLELAKSDKLLNQERLKTQALENLKVNPHRWRAMKYADSHYYEILQKKNHLQKELQKKRDLLQSKDDELLQKNELLSKMKDMLKRRPCNLTEDPDTQIMEYYRTIQHQKEKIKSLSAQVNMYEALVTDKYNKLSKLQG